MWMGEGSVMERTVVLCLLALSCPLSTHSIFFPTDGSKLSRLLAFSRTGSGSLWEQVKWIRLATAHMACVCDHHTGRTTCGLFLWYKEKEKGNKFIIS